MRGPVHVGQISAKARQAKLGQHCHRNSLAIKCTVTVIPSDPKRPLLIWINIGSVSLCLHVMPETPCRNRYRKGAAPAAVFCLLLVSILLFWYV
jgi:hypothetical protein